MSVSKVPKVHGELLDEPLENQLILLIKENNRITIDEMANQLNLSKSTVKRIIKEFTDSCRLERKDGKRYGYWEIK